MSFGKLAYVEFEKGHIKVTEHYGGGAIAPQFRRSWIISYP